jgi:hypothetical protein
MLYQVDDALLHAMSGIELSRVRTELRLLLPEAHQQKSDRVEKGRHCYGAATLVVIPMGESPIDRTVQ